MMYSTMLADFVNPLDKKVPIFVLDYDRNLTITSFVNGS